MSNDKLTAKEIFLQITILQKQLTESTQTSLHRLGDAISAAFEGEECDKCHEQIADICDVFKKREIILLKILLVYEKMYEDLQKKEENKVS